MSIAFACKIHDDLAIGYPFRDYWHPFFDVPDIGFLPIDGTLTYHDYPESGGRAPIRAVPDHPGAHGLRSASCYWQDEHH